MTGATAEHAKIVIEAPLTFLLSQLTILAELIGNRGGIAGGRGQRLGRFVVVVIVVLLVLAGVVGIAVVAAGGSGLSFVIGLVVVVVLLVVGLLGMFGLGFTGTGFPTGLFPVTGVDGMCKFLHALEGLRFSLLSYDVLNSFGQSDVVTVMEYAVIPMRADC